MVSSPFSPSRTIPTSHFYKECGAGIGGRDEGREVGLRELEKSPRGKSFASQRVTDIFRPSTGPQHTNVGDTASASFAKKKTASCSLYAIFPSLNFSPYTYISFFITTLLPSLQWGITFHNVAYDTFNWRVTKLTNNANNRENWIYGVITVTLSWRLQVTLIFGLYLNGIYYNLNNIFIVYATFKLN